MTELQNELAAEALPHPVPVADEAQAEHAAALLAQLTAGQYIFNGTALALEQSGEHQPPAPQILEKLHTLAEMGAITLSGEGADLAITAFDLRALENYASEDIISGLDALTDLHFDLDDGESEQPTPAKRRIQYKGPVSPAQLARLYRLRVKHDLNIQLIGLSEDARDAQVAVTVNAADEAALAQEVDAEERYRCEGDEVSRMLEASTGQRWRFDGMNVISELPFEEIDPDGFAFHMLHTLCENNAVTCELISTQDIDGNPHRYCYIMQADLMKLREAATSNLDEAAQRMNELVSVPGSGGWEVRNGRVTTIMPEDGKIRAEAVELLEKLEKRDNALTWDYHFENGHHCATLRHFDLEELRNIVTDIEWEREPSPTVLTQGMQHDGKMQEEPDRSPVVVWERFRK